jgi:hypothetical protein
VTSLYLFALVAGAWLLQQQAVLPDWTGATALVPLAVLWIVLARHSGAAVTALLHAVAIVTFAAAGFFWAAAVGSWKLADDLSEIWEGRDVELSGVIAEMVHPNDRGVRFLFDVERAYTLNARSPAILERIGHRLGCLHSHGGTGFLSCHKPAGLDRASTSAKEKSSARDPVPSAPSRTACSATPGQQ